MRTTALIAALTLVAGCSAGGVRVRETPSTSTSSSVSTSSTTSSTTSTSTTVSVLAFSASTSTTSHSRAPGGVRVVAPAGVGGEAYASWYGAESGGGTANGEHFDGTSLTFANRTMAFGTKVQFCHGGRCVVARCNDRGPFVAGRDFDLSRTTFASIADPGSGVIKVSWEVVA